MEKTNIAFLSTYYTDYSLVYRRKALKTNAKYYIYIGLTLDITHVHIVIIYYYVRIESVGIQR